MTTVSQVFSQSSSRKSSQVFQKPHATFEQIAQVIHAHDNFVICGHVSPDIDCFGSQLGLWHALCTLGKQAKCVLAQDEPIPLSAKFLPGMNEMQLASSFKGSCNVFIGVDVPTRERLGDAVSLLERASTTITIDHHSADKAMCEHVYVDPNAASASILVWEIVKLLVNEPPIESALCAYAGLIADTGGFRFQNTDAHAFQVASELVSCGVNPAWVSTQVFQSRSYASLRLEVLAIERMRVFANGQASLSWITQADFNECGAIKADAEPLVNTLRELNGVRVTCMLRESDSKVRCSLRAKDSTDVSVLARELGGGGHAGAAGFTLDLPLMETIGFMEERITSFLKVMEQ